MHSDFILLVFLIFCVALEDELLELIARSDGVLTPAKHVHTRPGILQSVKSVRTVCQYLQVVNLGGQNRSSSPSDHWTNVSCMVPEIQQMQSQRSYFFLASCR